MSSTCEAMEAALAANPDDVATHAAYADLLAEEGDPRGEYIRLQLALEDRDQPADRLRAMEQEAFTLRRRHEREWLGLLAPFVDPPDGAMVAEGVEHGWRRGWLDRVEVPRLTRDLARALAAAPTARLLREVVIHRTDAPRRTVGIPRGRLRYLQDAPWLATLRRLTLGDPSDVSTAHTDGTGLDRLVRRARRLRHLTVRAIFVAETPRVVFRSPRLRTLELFCPHRVPVGLLGSNKNLTRLTRLTVATSLGIPDEPDYPRGRPCEPDELAMLFRSQYLVRLRYLALRMLECGDAGVEELVASGLIARLDGLDLCMCQITDDGARALAACPDVPKLKYLHLDDNYLSPAGIGALAAVGVSVSRRQAFGFPLPGDDEILF